MILSENPRIEFTCEDNMELMGRAVGGLFKLGITDPPYGIDINMNMGRKKGKRKSHQEKTWDNAIPEEAYFDELQRVCDNQIIWGGNYFPLPLVKGWIFWDKEVPEGVSFADGELAWTSFDRTLRKVKVPYSGFRGSEGKIHPTQKPVALYKWLLQNYAKQGDTILDTHVGSGSIMIACWELGFDFVGCELDKEYYDAAVKRFKEHVLAHPKLFTQEQIKNEQLSLL